MREEVMSTNDKINYYVARSLSGKVTHLVRMIQTETTLNAEYFREGVWHEDSSAFTIADDGSFSKQISEAEATGIIDEEMNMHLKQDPESAIRTGFSAYFLGKAPMLPNPIPIKGSVSGGGWNVSFVLHSDPLALEFLAERSMQNPVHGRIHSDSTAVTLESFVDTFYIDQSIGETEEDGQRRMHEHNDRVAAELRAVGLL